MKSIVGDQTWCIQDSDVEGEEEFGKLGVLGIPKAIRAAMKKGSSGQINSCKFKMNHRQEKVEPGLFAS